MYFSPIQVHPLDADRAFPSNKSLKSFTTQSFPSIRRITKERSNTILSSYQQRQLATYQPNHSRLSTKKRVTTNATTIAAVAAAASTTSGELLNQTTPNPTNDDDLRRETRNMWQSIVTSSHVSNKPISKRSQHAIEDLQALQQEQTLQDPTGYNRQVLPNIRPVPKSKFVYKGLAYKESQKIPGVYGGSDDEEGALQKPLVSYNLAQAYARYEINAARAKQNLQQQPPPPSAATARMLPKEPSHDLRDIRKRIVRGTTLAYRPPLQTSSRTPGRGDHRSTLGSEVLLPVRSFNTIHETPSSLVFPTPPQTFVTAQPTPNLSQIFPIPFPDNPTNVSSL